MNEPSKNFKMKMEKQKHKNNKNTAVAKEFTSSYTYPIGKYKAPEKLNEKALKACIDDIRALPELLQDAIKKVNKKKKLQYTYRDGGWTIEQIVHHLADSHANAYIRFKLALTENNPTIAPYDENLWAETADVQMPIKVSYHLLKALHKKWVVLLENMDSNDWKRTYFHPAKKQEVALDEMISLYAWHGKHHVAQIIAALKKHKEH